MRHCPFLFFCVILAEICLCDNSNELYMDPDIFKDSQSRLDELNSIQQKIMGIPPEEEFLGELSSDQPLIMNLFVPPDPPSDKPDQKPYLFEGDIVLTKDQWDEVIGDAKRQLEKKSKNSSYDETRPKRTVTSNLSLRWDFPIPFYINTDSGVNEKAVLRGIDEWEKQTCATFTRVDKLNKTNALNFFLGNGCFSYVGKVGKVPQQVSIGTGCTSLGTVTHEIGHALGFFHEQSRFDRDDFVDILTQNIQNRYVGQFSKQGKKSMVDYGVGYDYGSVMHYDQSSFRKKKFITIETLEGDYQHTIGQRAMPSFSDIKRINFAYCNGSCTNQLDCQNGGYTDPKNCSKCRCPDGLGGTFCTELQKSDPKCGNTNLTAENGLKIISAQGKIVCYFRITAPETHAVYYEISNFSFTDHVPCLNDFLEIKYHQNLVRTGARLCKNFPRNTMSEANALFLIYKGSAKSSFSLGYRIGIPLAFASTPEVSTSDNYYTDDSSMSSESTPYPMDNICSHWSPCSAACGACGTTSRFCGGLPEYKVCNLIACPDIGCCAPAKRAKNLCIMPKTTPEPEYFYKLFGTTPPPDYYEDY